MLWAILTFHQINAPHDARGAATNGVVFIAEGRWFTGDEQEPWACEFVRPHAQAFIQAIHVAWYEVVLHVHPPCLNHLLYFPKFVDEGWGSTVGEGKR